MTEIKGSIRDRVLIDRPGWLCHPKGESEGNLHGIQRKGLCVAIFHPKSCTGPERPSVFGVFYDRAKDGKGFPVFCSWLLFVGRL